MAEDGGQPPATSGESPTVDRWRRRSLGFALAAVATVYLALALVLPAEVFWSPDEGAKLLQALSLRPGGARSSDIPYGGRGLDPELTFYPRLLHPQHPEALRSALYPQPAADGGVRFHWPPLFPLASLAPYRLLGARGLYLMPLAGGLLAAAAAGVFGRAVDPRAGAPAVLAVGFSSPVLFYSLLFWEHAPSVALGLGGLLALVVARRRSVGLLGAVPLLAGAVALRLESLLLVSALPIPLAVGVERRQRPWRWPRGAWWVPAAVALAVATALVGMWPGAARAVYGWVHGVLSTATSLLGFVARASGLLSPFPERLADAWFDLGVELGPAVPGPLAWVGVVGALVALAATAFREPVRGWVLAVGGCLVLAPSWWTLLSSEAYRAVHALLLPAPFLVLTALLLRPPPAARGRPALLLGMVTALYLVLGTALAMTRMVGGLEWGNRYLLPLQALGAAAAAVGAVAYARRDGERRPRLAVIAVTVACLVTGALYQVRGVRELLISKGSLEACRREVVNARGPVVTDLYWLPAALAVTFAERPLYTLQSRRDLGPWLERFGDRSAGFLLITSAAQTDEVERWLGSVPTWRLRMVGVRSLAGLLVADVVVSEAEGGV